MGLFFPSDPIVHGQRAKGLPRYQELLERDWKSFLFADFVTLGLCIPYGLGVGYALLSSSLLVLLPVCILGGLLVGPAISGMMDALFRRRPAVKKINSNFFMNQCTCLLFRSRR